MGIQQQYSRSYIDETYPMTPYSPWAIWMNEIFTKIVVTSVTLNKLSYFCPILECKQNTYFLPFETKYFRIEFPRLICARLFQFFAVLFLCLFSENFLSKRIPRHWLNTNFCYLFYMDRFLLNKKLFTNFYLITFFLI